MSSNTKSVRRRAVATWATRAWMLAVSAWTLVGVVQLRAVDALVQREGVARGRPITDEDHFSQLPELSTAFDGAGLNHHGVIEWTLMLGLFAVSGLAIRGVAWIRSEGNWLTNAGALSLWLLSGAVAIANWDTLDLVTWLGN